MASGTEWFLEIQGKKTGPFTVEQIVGLYRDKEVPGTARVTSGQNNPWITVQLLVEANSQPKQFVPPPRPSSAITSINLEKPAPAPGPDPTSSLFEALQAAKERKQSPSKNLPRGMNAEDTPPLIPFLSPLFDAVPARAWMVAGAAVFFGTVVWGIQRFARQVPNSALMPPSSTSSTVQTAVRPATPPPPAMTPNVAPVNIPAGAGAPGHLTRLTPVPPPVRQNMPAPANPPPPTYGRARPSAPARVSAPPNANSFNNNAPMSVPENLDERAANNAPPQEQPSSYPETDAGGGYPPNNQPPSHEDPNAVPPNPQD